MSLSRNSFFQRFWLGQTASNLGDAFGFVAMPLLVFEATHSVVKMGYVTGLTAAGQLLVTRAGARFGVATAMACVGVCLLFVAAAGAFSPLGRAGADPGRG